jgi:1-acyl-sn-glycerol-3-phosphate acyltransferase
MSPWTLLGLAALFLVGPWFLMPRPGQRPEVHGRLLFFWWLNAIYCSFWHRMEPARSGGLPERGPALLIANHTSGVDPFVLQASCRRVLRFLIAKELYDYWLFHPICRGLGCIPVRRDGSDLAATRAALRVLEQGQVVPIFPEGRITRQPGRELGQGKAGVAFIALRARVPVIPAYIWGTPETSQIWKALVTPSRARVLFGPPVDLSDFLADAPADKTTIARVAARMMEAIRALQRQAHGAGREGVGALLTAEHEEPLASSAPEHPVASTWPSA